MLSRCVPIPMSSIFITIFRLRLKPIDSKPIPGAHGRSRISSARPQADDLRRGLAPWFRDRDTCANARNCWRLTP